MISEITKTIKCPVKMKSDNIEFKLNDVESQRARDFINEHRKTCHHSFRNNNLPATGEHFYFKIVPGGLGIGVCVGCLYCKIEQDVTDIDSW